MSVSPRTRSGISASGSRSSDPSPPHLHRAAQLTPARAAPRACGTSYHRGAALRPARSHLAATLSLALSLIRGPWWSVLPASMDFRAWRSARSADFAWFVEVLWPRPRLYRMPHAGFASSLSRLTLAKHHRRGWGTVLGATSRPPTAKPPLCLRPALGFRSNSVARTQGRCACTGIGLGAIYAGEFFTGASSPLRIRRAPWSRLRDPESQARTPLLPSPCRSRCVELSNFGYGVVISRIACRRRAIRRGTSAPSPPCSL